LAVGVDVVDPVDAADDVDDVDDVEVTTSLGGLVD
jgi:hypothetical protein